MSEFGGLWKHEETQHALKSGRIISYLTVEEEDRKVKYPGQSQQYKRKATTYIERSKGTLYTATLFSH